MMPGHGHGGHDHIMVDGVDVHIMRLPNGRVMCHLLMFQQFDTTEELAAVLRRERGRLWDTFVAPRVTGAGVITRPNIYDLGDAELSELIHAVREIKNNGVYDDFVRRHDAVMSDTSNIHAGPAFLPWHRVFIHEFEQALQTVSAGLRLPFWNWADDAAAGKSAPLWQTQGARTYFGGDGDPKTNIVTSGPCADWRILMHTPQAPVYRSGLGLLRSLGQDAATLPQLNRLRQVLSVQPYDSAPWDYRSDTSRSFRNALEGFAETGSAMHNRVHVWIGGDMEMPTSPSDPVFFLHHAFVDCIWAAWQKLHPSESYLPASGGPPCQNIDDRMPHLWSATTPRQTLDTVSMGYQYPALAL